MEHLILTTPKGVYLVRKNVARVLKTLWDAKALINKECAVNAVGTRTTVQSVEDFFDEPAPIV